MYIFELIAKLRQDYKNKTEFFKPKTKVETKEYEKCSHIFVPIDSTRKILACSKCGLIAHREDLEKVKNPNFFIRD